MRRLLGWLAIGGAVAGGALWFLRTVWFHRDPHREPAETGDVIISPADGVVVYARPFKNGVIRSEKLGESISVREILRVEHGNGSGWILGIYLSPLDVHFNYAPCEASVEEMHHVQAAVNLPMLDMWEYVRMVWLRRLVQLFGRRFHLENERQTIMLQAPDRKLALVLIADKFVNKINCFVKPGDSVQPGQKLAFISRGSQADVVIWDEDVTLTVQTGDRVIGGHTVIARSRAQA